MRHIPMIIVVPALALGGLAHSKDCLAEQQTKADRYTVTVGVTPHTKGLPSAWKGRHVAELVEAYGEPDMILETSVRHFVIFGDPYAVSYVYTPLPGVEDKRYRAYVISKESGEILAFHNR